jgi:hypothetical protein
MSNYPIKAIRLIAGNPALARKVRSYLDQRGKISLSQWRKNILPVLRTVENDILIKIKSYNLSEWQMSNLNNILGQVQNIINSFSSQFTSSVIAGQDKLAAFAAASVDKEIALIGLTSPLNPVITQDILATLEPMTKVFTEFFAQDLAKIVRSDITMGIVNGESTSAGARTIRDNFGNTSERIKFLTNKKTNLQKQFDTGIIGKKEFNLKVGKINKDLAKGSQMSFARAERIARTEMNRAASFAREIRGFDIMEANPQARRMWINLHKPGARISHIAVESATRAHPIRLDEPFTVGGYKCQFPLDPALPAKESVGCGCAIVIVNPKDFSDIQNLTKENLTPRIIK